MRYLLNRCLFRNRSIAAKLGSYQRALFQNVCGPPWAVNISTAAPAAFIFSISAKAWQYGKVSSAAPCNTSIGVASGET